MVSKADEWVRLPLVTREFGVICIRIGAFVLAAVKLGLWT